MADEQVIQPLTPGQFNNTLRDLISYYEGVNNKNSAAYTSPIPVVISLDVDGIAGIKVGNLFNVTGTPGEILPASFRGVNAITGNANDKRDIAFLVKSMGHNVEGNYWTTHIEGYPFIYPTEGRDPEPKESPKTEKQTEATVTNEALKKVNEKPTPKKTPTTSTYNP